MIFTSFKAIDFRNLFSDTVNTDSENIILSGINGQGKTNILELLYLLCYGSSFRTPYLKECIRWEKDGFFIKGEYYDDEKDEKGTISLSFFNGHRKIVLDENEIKDRKELIYRFPCIVFSHEDISFVKGEPENRRKFFDQMMSLYSPSFFDSSRMYRLILSQRNAAIKSGNNSLISLYDERLAKYGLEIMNERSETVEEFNKIFPFLFSEITKTDFKLEIVYQPSWKINGSEEDILDILKNNIDRDIKMNTTTSGVHRDRFVVMSQYGPFAQIGSTGQLRLCSLIFRIAEAIYFTKMTGKKPILLLDDVLLELDSEKRGYLLASLPDYSQAWYTFLPNENYNEKNSNSLRFNVENGVIYG